MASLKSSSFWSNVFDVAVKRQEIKKTEEQLKNPSTWQNDKSGLQIQQLAQKKAFLFNFDALIDEFSDLREISFIVSSMADEQALNDKLSKLEEAICKLELSIFLTGKYDKCSAILTIQAGTGGRDAADWVALLLKMYQRYCESKNWHYRVLSQNFTEGGGPEGRIGVKEVSLAIEGEFIYGFLKREAGAHRLVRISPFSAKQLRQTSFAQVDVAPKIPIEKTSFDFKPDELKLDTFRSAGHGGQNVNKRETAVRITHLPTGLQASCQVERTQAMNRKIALAVLAAKIVAMRETTRNQELTIERDKTKLLIDGGKKQTADFGRQIRSYVAHPYKLVKDHRTEVSTSDIEGVLNGKIDQFIQAEIGI